MNSQEVLLETFLERWPPQEVERMHLGGYVGLGNDDTFCRWVEIKTKPLGSMRGWSSIKFGIYERRIKDRFPKTYDNGNQYSWAKSYHAKNENDAYRIVHHNILKIIDCAIIGDFATIDDIDLPDLFKWKVAFLYSGERLVPIFQRETLHKIAAHYGMSLEQHMKVSAIQELMIQNKPATEDIYAYMRRLYTRFSNDADLKLKDGSLTKKKGRKGTNEKNTNSQGRAIKGRTVIAEQRHNIIQNALKAILLKEFGDDALITMEKNFVDLKLEQPDFVNFYEVKSDTYALNCVRQALGQLLYYVFADDDNRKKNLIIVGQNKPSVDEINYINYIKSVVTVPFEYIAVDISKSTI